MPDRGRHQTVVSRTGHAGNPHGTSPTGPPEPGDLVRRCQIPQQPNWPHIASGYRRRVTGNELCRTAVDGVGLTRGAPADPELERRWDRRVDSWEAVAATPAFLGFRDAVMAELTLDAESVVLDLGCGTGLLTLPIARRCGHVVGVDASSAMLERLGSRAAREGVENLELIHGDMRLVPMRDASVDVVVSCYAFHHLPDADKRVVLREVGRVLRPGGRLVVADMMFRIGLGRRDRRIVASKAWQLVCMGPAGIGRLLRNGLRIATRRWEHPAPLEWWEGELARLGFGGVRVRALAHEAGLAVADRVGRPPVR